LLIALRQGFTALPQGCLNCASNHGHLMECTEQSEAVAMHIIAPATRGLRTLVELGSDRLWFGLAVLLGLFLAAWLGDMMVSSLITPVEDGLGY